MSELERELEAVIRCSGIDYPFPVPAGVPDSAAVLVLFRGSRLFESDILLTLRSRAVATHAGQVAFPGGGAEFPDGGDFRRTALREAEEEVGISGSHIRICGVLPSLPTVTGGFSVVPVLGCLDSAVPAPELSPDVREVERAGWARVRDLRRSRTEAVRPVRGVAVSLPEFRWNEDRLWGLSALIFDLILRRYDTICP